MNLVDLLDRSIAVSLTMKNTLRRQSPTSPRTKRAQQSRLSRFRLKEQRALPFPSRPERGSSTRSSPFGEDQ